ncbi:beta-1,4-galactosyltransferase galt-1 isoform X2 [Leptinotarsa decemlineata]|uniref:beta-1,4-galactosyltransferase galt-1 isoform X2 n=1 Tax=Leptinotarsa decemlineata TaxID=7539 RepID=UPI003D309CD5
MGSSSGGKKKYVTFRSRQRANLSFFIVIMFFAVFGIIVFTEIFFIDERGRAVGVFVRHGSLTYQHKQEKAVEYEDGFQVVRENQLPPYPDNATLTEGSWQKVNGTRNKFFVFSAFYDRRKGQKIIRVIGATRTRGPEKVWCRLWYKTNEFNSSSHVSVTVAAQTKVIRENWNLKYSACFVMCLLTNKTVPTAVSIVARVKDPPSNLLAVINNYNETVTTPQNKFGVCVKPLHFDYNRAMQVLEFIELNRLMGVEHFTFYNHTIGDQVECLLKNYVDRGLVTVLPWDLNMISQKEIRTEGLFAALNDCLYRSMYKYSHVLLIDLDEYIVPKHNDTLPQLIDYLTHRHNTRSTGSFSFQNAFFYLQWSDDDSVFDFEDPVSANLVTLKKTRRRSKLHPHKQRSKYICRPELTVEAGNHFVWEFIPGHGTLNVPSDAAILHHYRICEFGGDDCIKTSSVVDKTAYRYKYVLTTAVRQQYERLKQKCNLADLSVPTGKVFNKLMSLLKPSLER